MKQFFESYGGVALGILALLVLIAMITPVGNIIKTSLQGTTNKFASSMNGQLDDAMVATAEAQESAMQKSSVKMNNINKSGVVGNFLAKGNLVEINGTQYRVLEVNGTQAKVMSMENIGSSNFNSSSVTISFGSKTGQKYAGSNLDNAMIAYYNSLPSEIQDAIVEQNINQSMYSWTSGTNSSASFSSWYSYGFTASSTASGTNYYLTRITDINIGARKVYTLDVDDVIDYLGPNSTAKDVNEMFFGERNNVSRIVWLRSANSDFDSDAFRVYGGYGGLSNSGRFSDTTFEVRPAFVIDLSLL